MSATLETSDDFETWVTVGSPVTLGAAGSSLGAIDAKTDAFGRYARIQISLAGTAPTATFSVALNTFPSS